MTEQEKDRAWSLIFSAVVGFFDARGWLHPDNERELADKCLEAWLSHGHGKIDDFADKWTWAHLFGE